MITFEIIEKAVYDLCVEANTSLPESALDKIIEAHNNEKNEDAKEALMLILENAKLAYELKKPLCQDTGQVLIFIKLGENCQVKNLNDAINSGVEKAYRENFYRKSVVKNAVFDRTNTATNTPCIIHTEIVQGEDIQIELLLKGAGSENKSQVKMLSPTANESEIIEFVKHVAKDAGASACPPFFIGIGIGGTMEYAALLSKKALLLEKNMDENHKNLAQKILKALNNLNIGAAARGGSSTALDVKILTDFTHIASMPVAVTINCHSLRHAKCTIEGTGKCKKQNVKCEIQPLNSSTPHLLNSSTSINTSDLNTLKSLKQGDNILLSGEVYTARDMAHKRLVEMLKKGEKLPFDLKNKIIFYAGPCPCAKNEIIGSVGPTTASRMDKFAPALYKAGLLATVGKGGRSDEVKKVIKETGGIYFSSIGGIACYLAQKVVKKELIAFEDLGTEAIYKLEIKDFPVKVELC